MLWRPSLPGVLSAWDMIAQARMRLAKRCGICAWTSHAEAFASDLDEFACQTIEANFRPVKFYRGEVDGDIT